MTRLRQSDPADPGITRRRRGRGFSYASSDGRRINDADTLDRIKKLAIPPAWTDVWICRWPNGHIQEVGTDDAGRRQYRYHDEWRVQRDREKFIRVEAFGEALPQLRTAVTRDLARKGFPRERVVATVVRLLDLGCFRVGGAEYAEEHDTFGITTLRKEHVRIEKGVMVFDYPAKGSIRRRVKVDDDGARKVVSRLHSRQQGGSNLFAFRQGKSWVDVSAQDVNDYIKSNIGEEFSAKDFRTWSATVLTAAALVDAPEATTRSARHKAVVAAVAAVADELGNTPAVARSSYVDPRIIEQYEDQGGLGDEATSSSVALAPLGTATLAAKRRRHTIEKVVREVLDES